MQSVSTKHRALGRSIVQLARKPPPDKPVDVGSVPVAGPLVDSLLGNGNGAGANAQPSGSPNPGNGGSGGNGNSGGNSGNGGNGNGNGGSGGNAGGSTPTPATSPTSGSGGTVVPPESIVSSPNSPTPTPGNPSSSSSANGAGGGGNTASSSGAGVSGTSAGVGSGQSAPVNAGTVSSTAISASLGASTSGALAVGIPSSSQYSLGSGGSKQVSTTSPSPTITTSTAVSSGKQLSGGAIAGIIIVSLFFLLALILAVVRRRSIARRVELRRQWWFGRHDSGGNSSLANNGSPVESSGEAPGSRRSARSSFATNFDQGLMLSVDPPPMLSRGVAPDLPPMAEVRERNSVLISTGAAIARRESMNSMLSNGIDPDAQYLTVPGHDSLDSSTPMCVRPFSPSESFAFPKPPAPPSSTASPIGFSGTQGPASPEFPATLVLSTPPRAFITDPSPVSVKTRSLYPQISTPDVGLSPSITPTNPANPSVNPFADPVKPGFADGVVVRRPFQPSLNDELAVRPGDRIHLLQIFTDGWAFIEKLASTEGERHERGLIPLDCLRDAGQALPALPTQKRVSSYGPDQLVAVAL